VLAAEACLKVCIAQTKKEAVCCTDLRASALFSPAVTDQLIKVMKTDNRALDRNGILLTGGATFALQLQRMFRECSGGERRRLFTDPALVVAWLGERLNDAERARLQKFILEYDPPLAGGAERSPLEETPARPESRSMRSPRAFAAGDHAPESAGHPPKVDRGSARPPEPTERRRGSIDAVAVPKTGPGRRQ